MNHGADGNALEDLTEPLKSNTSYQRISCVEPLPLLLGGILSTRHGQDFCHCLRRCDSEQAAGDHQGEPPLAEGKLSVSLVS